ncbi:hypothetical protein ACYJW8_15595 [Frateuria aurantia]
MAEDPAPSPTVAVGFFDELSELLKWSQERVGPLTFTGLAIAAWLWLDFLTYFRLPISFLSPSSLAALPALFGVAVFVVLYGVLLVSLPSLALWTPLYEAGPSLISLGRHGPHKLAGEIGPVLPSEVSGSVRWTMLVRWLAFGGMMAVLCLAWVGWLALHHGHGAVWPVLALSVFAGVLWLWLAVKKLTGRYPSLSFACSYGAAICFQLAATLSIIAILLDGGLEPGFYVIAGKLMVYFLAIVVIWLLQALVALRIRDGLYPGFLKQLLLSAIGVMLVAAAVPRVGAIVVGYPLRLKGADGQSCVRLMLASDALKTVAVAPLLLDTSRPGSTLNLNFAVHLDGSYWVKTDPPQGRVYSVPDAAVTGIVPCIGTPAGAQPPAGPISSASTRMAPKVMVVAAGRGSQHAQQDSAKMAGIGH